MFTSRKKRMLNGRPRLGEAVIVSFFGGDPYYARCAKRLAEQCDRFDLCYDICEYHPVANEEWVNICRKKIKFYTRKADEHDSAVMWVDIDTQIIADPRRIVRSTADIGAFLRNFHYLVGFDPMLYARLLHPGYLLFGRSARTRAFMETLRALDLTADPTGTDDYVLQEALTSHAGQLSLELFSPADIVSSNESQRRGDAVLQHGDSGKVNANIAVAAQHDATILTFDRQKRVLVGAADSHIKVKNYRAAVPFLVRVLSLKPDDAASVIKLLKVYRELGWKKKYAELATAAEAQSQILPQVLRHRYEVALGERKDAWAAKLAEQIQQDGREEDKAFVQSRQYRCSFDQEARRRGIDNAARVRLWWWERPYPGNLGDMINPYLVEGLTGIPPVYSTRAPRVLAIGSIIKFALKGDKVWGAGCPSADQAIEPDAIFHSVRGPLTRRMILEAGGDCPPVYGDPAWLLPLIYPDRKPPKTHRVGLIRHFTHRAQPIRLDDDVREIEIIRDGRAGIEAFLDEMLSCEAIVSSSLHGVIIANAYGIPARLATFRASDRQVHGDGMKFDDYFLSVGRSDVQALDLSGFERLAGEIALACTDNPAQEIDLDALLTAAPFAIDAGVLVARRQQLTEPRPGSYTLAVSDTSRLLKKLRLRRRQHDS